MIIIFVVFIDHPINRASLKYQQLIDYTINRASLKYQQLIDYTINRASLKYQQLIDYTINRASLKYQQVLAAKKLLYPSLASSITSERVEYYIANYLIAVHRHSGSVVECPLCDRELRVRSPAGSYQRL